MVDLIILDTERKNFPSSNLFIKRLYEYLEDKYFRLIYSFFIIPTVKKYLKDKNTKIIAADKETEIILKKYSIHFSCIDGYVQESEHVNYERGAIDFIRKLPKLFPIIDRKYMGISLWKMDEPDIYLSFIRSLFDQIEKVNKVVEVEKPKKIIVFSVSTLGIIQKQLKGRLEIIDRVDAISKLKQNILQLFVPLAIKTINSEFIEKIKRPIFKPKKNRGILFFEGERSFYYAYPFLKKMNKNVTILHTEEYNRKENDFDYDVINNYITKESKERLILFKRDLKKQLSSLKKSAGLRKNIKYKEVNLSSLLANMFDYLYIIGYLQSAFYLEGLNNLFVYSKPKLIITHGEGQKKNNIIINLSKKYGLKSLFVMHGSFGINYLYGNLLSDNVSVYGQKYKDILTYLGNESEKIVITGNPAWDYLVEDDFKNKDVLNLNLPHNKNIIILATMIFPFELRNNLVYPTIKALTHLPDCHLVIKLHPEEKPDFYKELINQYELNATIVEDLSLLHPLIKISKLVIISNSTVGLETLILNKPLIDINLTNKPYYQDYVKEGVALGIRKEEDLLPAIKSILENETIRKKLEKKRKRYVYEHAYKMDGKAAERVADLITRMIR